MSSVPRFFVARAALNVAGVTLPPDDAHHVRNVLRLSAGDRIEVCLGDGIVHGCRLAEVSPGRVLAEIEESAPSPAEPRTRITVAQALPKNEDKAEQVLQHGTEIGAAAFSLFLSARSVARPDEGRLKRRFERWRAVVKSAAQQSGRGALPEVDWGVPPAADFDAVFALHERASVPLARALRDVPASASRLLVLVGPEGGFTEREVEDFAARGAVAVSLGPRVLRTETAALVALAQILFAREETG